MRWVKPIAAPGEDSEPVRVADNVLVMGGTQERRWNFWYWLGLAFAAYLLPLIAFLVDGIFFGGKLFQWVGPEIHSTLDNVYGPVIFLWYYLFG